MRRVISDGCQAAQQIGDMRQNIVEALETIPAILEETNAIADLYWNEESMHRAACALYVSVLQALQYILLWFKEKSHSKHRQWTTSSESANLP